MRINTTYWPRRQQETKPCRNFRLFPNKCHSLRKQFSVWDLGWFFRLGNTCVLWLAAVFEAAKEASWLGRGAAIGPGGGGRLLARHDEVHQSYAILAVDDPIAVDIRAFHALNPSFLIDQSEDRPGIAHVDVPVAIYIAADEQTPRFQFWQESKIRSCAVFIRGAGGVSCIHGGGVGEKFQQARSVFPVEAQVVGVESLGIRAQDRNAEAAAVAAIGSTK